jgi:hypothetical protein
VRTVLQYLLALPGDPNSVAGAPVSPFTAKYVTGVFPLPPPTLIHVKPSLAPEGQRLWHREKDFVQKS